MLQVLLRAPWAAAALQELGRPVLAALQCEYSPSAFMMTRFCPPYGSCQTPESVDQALRQLRRWQCLELLFRARCSAAGGEEMQAVLCGLEEAARLLEGKHAQELAAVHRFLTQSVRACAHCGFYGRWAACAQCQLVCTPAHLACAHLRMRCAAPGITQSSCSCLSISDVYMCCAPAPDRPSIARWSASRRAGRRTSSCAGAHWRRPSCLSASLL